MPENHDFLFRGKLDDFDPAMAELIDHEAARQARKLIMIPSESEAAEAVREAAGSVFQNLYAEGYPDPRTRTMVEADILDYEAQLGYYRRNADPRYYKGVEYCDIVEALARRRCAEVFATPTVSADQIFVNVQPLSGAPANNAVYEALVKPGDTVMGMHLNVGGHLTHGSPVNRSGKHYNIVAYTVDLKTERLDYDAIKKLALECRPKMIIAGYTSYPYAPDWKRFREIADAVGAYLLADISHVAGMVVAQVFPTPVGYADVVTFTTHKTLCGPRAAVILTTNAELAKKVDRAVFPGEQGGPHMHTIAAMATAFKLAGTDQFKALQKQILNNAITLAGALKAEGLRVAYDGTESHMLLVDCKTVKGPDGTPLMGDAAARILDLVGIVCNRNTIPGDVSAGQASGLRLGTPWVTQRGMKEPEMKRIAWVIAGTLKACVPFRDGDTYAAKISFDALELTKLEAEALAAKAGIVFKPVRPAYPHYWTLKDRYGREPVTFELDGSNVFSFLQAATTNDVSALKAGADQQTFLLEADGKVLSGGVLYQPGDRSRYQLVVPGAKAARAAAWLRDLSDGYVSLDDDPYARLPGPVNVRVADRAHETALPIPDRPKEDTNAVAIHKPYFVGQKKLKALAASRKDKRPFFKWDEPQGQPNKRTTLYDTHKKLGARVIPFAGYEMPVWYTTVVDEHTTVRTAAGLFDATHMGVWDCAGQDACAFLDLFVPNDVYSLKVGESLYSYFLDPDGYCIDDTMIYRRGPEKYMVVVNASNNDKDWAWFNAVKDGQVTLDHARPWITWQGKVTLRDLRDRQWGDECRADLPLQGPRSRDILLTMADTPEFAAAIQKLKRAELCEGSLAGHPVVVSRTGYTGEPLSFEIFVHPDRAPELWDKLLAAGKPFGLKPIGLGARDSLRTEAGLPLYGHEMAGPLDLTPDDAGFGAFARLYKPFFIGRSAFIAHRAEMTGQVVRFRMNEKNVRVAKQLDLLVDKRSKVVGKVLSCAVDTEGFFTGQAFVERKYMEEGTPLWVAGLPSREGEERPRAKLTFGDKVMGLEAITVVSRMPKHKKIAG